MSAPAAASVRVAVLVSGSGSNLQAIVDAERAGQLGRANVAVVISNVAGVRALERAHAAGVETVTLPHRNYPNREAFDAAVLAELVARRIDFVVLAGFMRLLSPLFVRAYAGRILNIHPSLLPAFPGAHAVRDALAAGATKSGVTVHLVDEGLDSGPVLAQTEVAIAPGDTEATLLERIHLAEHALYPAVVRDFAGNFALSR